MAEIQFDAISWTRDGNNDLMPLLPPLPFNYPENDEVEAGVVFKYDNSGLGTLTPGSGAPTMPILTVTDMGSGVARFTISGADAGTSNKVYARMATAISWPIVATVTIPGNGSADAILASGPYLAKALSYAGSAASPSSNEPVIFHLVDVAAGYDRSDFGDTFKADAIPVFFAEFGEMITYLRGVQSVALAAIQGDAITANDPSTGIDVSLGNGSWEISADELDFGSGPIVPKAQDQIITLKGEIWTVVESGVLDAEQLIWTIPGKRCEYKELP